LVVVAVLGRWWLADNFDGAFGNPAIDFVLLVTSEPYEFASDIAHKYRAFGSDAEHGS
jgi:hypothetical protein